MTKEPGGAEEQLPDDLAYLLRLWRMRGAGAAGWRASLADPDSGLRHGFASLDDLFSFLRQQIAPGSGADDAEDRTR
jgi:hypothetical protein